MYDTTQTVFAADTGDPEDDCKILFVPAILAASSALYFLLSFLPFINLPHTNIEAHHVKSRTMNFRSIFLLRALRSTCSLALLGLSAYELVIFTNLVHLSLFCFYMFATILSFVSLFAQKQYWKTISTQHVASLYVTTFIIYAYRSLKPFVVYNEGGKSEVTEWTKFVLLGVVGGFVPLFSPRPFIPTQSHPLPSPEETASYFSLCTFSHLDRVILMAYRFPHLSLDQLPDIPEKDTSSVVTANAFPHLDPVTIDYRKGHIFWRLLRLFRWDYFVMALFQVAKALVKFIAPLSLKKLLEYVEGSDEEATMKPWVWILLIGLGPIIYSIIEQLLFIRASRVILHLEAILTQLTFEHSLRIRLAAPLDEEPISEQSILTSKVASTGMPIIEVTANAEAEAVSTTLATEDTESDAPQSLTETEASAGTPSTSETQKVEQSLVGTMTNLITTDLGILKLPSGHFLDLPSAVLQVFLSVAFLYGILGWSALLGLLTIIIALPVPTLLGKFIMDAQKKKMEYTDKRVQRVTQNIQVMRMIKLFAWEPKVERQIFERRDSELQMVRKGRIIDNVAMFLQSLLPLLTMAVTYATYTLVMKHDLSASVVFSSMAIFEMLRDNIHRTFWTAPMFLRAKVSLDRFNDFFAKAELLPSSNQGDDMTSEIGSSTDVNDIKFFPSKYTWTKDGAPSSAALPDTNIYRFALRFEKELVFQRGAINLILGPTASGKTSVLMALLGEMYANPLDGRRSFQLPRNHGVAYAAQESWVFNDTIRNNIIFGESFDEDRYNQVLEQCALEPDIARFDAGDLTEIGERGITLSGGQKARITLARAVYSSALTLLLDDVLSALDVHTSKWIVEKCFRGSLFHGRTVILVTHNVALVAPVAGFSIELSSDGKILHQGALNEIMHESSTLNYAQKELEMLEKTATTDEFDIAVSLGQSQKGKLIVAEEIALGRVAWPAIKLYTESVGGPLFWALFIGGILLSFFLSAFQVWFLGYWASQYTDRESASVPAASFLGIFILIACVANLVFAISATFYVFGNIKASRIIHAKLITSILRAPLRWLDTVPLARIVSRCTIDMEIIDDTLGNELSNLIELTATLTVSLTAVIYIAGWVAALLGIAIALVGYICGSIYLKAQLCVKRENSNAKSPVISHFQAALGGLVSIRAYGVERTFKATSRKFIDRYTRSSSIQYDLNRWIAVRSDTLGGIFSGLVGAYLVYGGGKAFVAGDIGFALNQILSFSQTLLLLVRVYNTFEVQANSAERIYDFLVIDQETLPTEEGKPPAYWPASGDLKATKLCAQYSKDGPLVLHDISFDIKSGERVGVAGRTGAGKSSLALAILRAIPTSGEVLYDGKETATLNLDSLRSNITLIPQHPELLAGTLRENLDPFSQYDDATLNSALQSAGLWDLSSCRVTSSTDLSASLSSTTLDNESHHRQGSTENVTLDTNVEAGGLNFSLGQRQIVAIARAIVRKSKILLLDEATASIDYETDDTIQRSIRTELSKDTTVITVAHRLQTIMDSDRVMVLDAGCLAEFDTPAILLQQENSLLKSMVDESPDRDKLRRIAGVP